MARCAKELLQRGTGALTAVCLPRHPHPAPPSYARLPARPQDDGAPKKGVKALEDGKGFVKNGVEYRCGCSVSTP